MKIAGFTQLHNELEKGNLLNWFKCMDAVCDSIFIYDQNSTDGSLEEYKKHPNTYVIESPINDFSNEITCKGKLLNYLLRQAPDTNWIFWMDGDTLLDNRLLAPKVLSGICQAHNNVDGMLLGHYNLWRSDIHYRLDEGYHGLHGAGVFALWRNNGRLQFPTSGGLHLPQFPNGMGARIRLDYSLIHRGFSTDKSIVQKYLNYRSRGQKGWDLDRLIDERVLDVKELPAGTLPSWFELTDPTDPRTKEKLINLFSKELQ